MEGKESGSGGGSGTHGTGDGVGDVVELEVEEDVEALVGEGGDDPGPLGDEEFETDLDPAAVVAEATGESQGGGGVGEIKGDDQAVLRRRDGSGHSENDKGGTGEDTVPPELLSPFEIIVEDSADRKPWRVLRRTGSGGCALGRGPLCAYRVFPQPHRRGQ